jgi:hypothetical protein
MKFFYASSKLALKYLWKKVERFQVSVLSLGKIFFKPSKEVVSGINSIRAEELEVTKMS